MPGKFALMKRTTTSAFTLIEMLTVMAVIAILASLVVAVNAFAHKKAALARAEGEIKTYGAACENYKGDFAGYPRDIPPNGVDSFTDKLDPRDDGDPTKKKYEESSLYLYKCLSGDAKPGTDATRAANRTDVPDGKPETKGYCEFKPDQLDKNSKGEIKFIVDPWGNSYGYSTAGAEADEKYREEVQKNPNTPRQGKFQKGFSPSYDMWSTAGVINKGGDLNEDRKRWVKSW
jgi:prepilin-type N-terminal cleavage/methylation domain-containing protein